MRQSGPDTGFILQFTGGEDGRQTSVEFSCDSTIGKQQFATISLLAHWIDIAFPSKELAAF